MKFPPSSFAPLLALGSLLVGLQGHGLAQSLTGQDAHPNLLTNGSFEKGMEGWELSTAHNVGQATIDEAQKHEGHSSMRIDNAMADDTHPTETVILKPWTRYKLAGWIKATKIANEGVGKGECGASLALLEFDEKTRFVSSSNEWSHVMLDFTTTDKTEVKLGPRVGYRFKKSTGTAWFADLTLTELGPGSHQPPRKR